MQNALAALAVASLAVPSVPLADHIASFRSFPGLPHRMEGVGRLGAVLFVNDSKATNADSTEKALTSWPGDIYWIAGGTPKEGGIAPLAPYFSRVAKAYLIGMAADDFARTLNGQVPCEVCVTLDKALAAAARDAAESSAAEPVVLLSPACASYDQFRSYGHRGDVFRALVASLIAEHGEGRG
jgi:UDP-N-acetylmuramoylalanine--D-glutamate ligase